MNELVFIQNDQALTTSLKVAEVFEKQHKDVLRAIENLKAQNCAVKKFFFEDSYKVKGNNKTYKMYLMNFNGFSLLVMGFTGEKALQFKLDFIDSFDKMKNALNKLIEKRKTAEWQEARNASRRGWRPLTDAIQKLIELAREQGSTTDDKVFYMTYAKLMNKMLHIKSGSRDKIEAWQNYELEKFEFMLKCIIAEKVPAKENHKKIYSAVKQAIENYCTLSFINQRFVSENNT